MTQLHAKLRKNFLIRTGIAGVVLAGFFFFLFLPQYWAVKDLAETVDGLHRENQMMQTTVLASGHSGRKLQEIREKLQTYRSMIPMRSRLPEVLDQVATRAQADGLEVISIRPLHNVAFLDGDQELFRRQDQQVYEAILQMEATGYFFEIGRYLSSLETAPYKILLKKVDVKRPRTEIEGREPELTLNIVFSVLMRFPSDEFLG